MVQDQSRSIEIVSGTSGHDRQANNCSSRDNTIMGTLPSDDNSESVKLLAVNPTHAYHG